ncbi:hypothetical protein [Paraburkholderia sp. ZP32-5]|uniref:hypothetical protein n=1 Tax=Paraburkholderia sp. ZP32-5 TaxID=2883245 RepID=UPI001F31F12D|nr:hypothetical protein [Paraburkholderia sp. ZP32-5]
MTGLNTLADHVQKLVVEHEAVVAAVSKVPRAESQKPGGLAKIDCCEPRFPLPRIELARIGLNLFWREHEYLRLQKPQMPKVFRCVWVFGQKIVYGDDSSTAGSAVVDLHEFWPTTFMMEIAQ